MAGFPAKWRSRSASFPVVLGDFGCDVTWQAFREIRLGRLANTASFPVVLGDFGCDVTCQACRENSPRTPRAIALGSKPPLVTRIARTGPPIFWGKSPGDEVANRPGYEAGLRSFLRWLVVPRGKSASANQKHYPELGSESSSVWNVSARFSDVIIAGNQWWCLEMSAIFSG